MLCCMIAALIIAHVTAIVRRWLVFLGLVRPAPGEDADTMFARIARWLRRRRVRRFVTAAVAVELLVGGAWASHAHGAHLYRLGDQAVGFLRGEQVHYVGLCDKSGKDRTIRVAIKSDGTISVRQM